MVKDEERGMEGRRHSKQRGTRRERQGWRVNVEGPFSTTGYGSAVKSWGFLQEVSCCAGSEVCWKSPLVRIANLLLQLEAARLLPKPKCIAACKWMGSLCEGTI